MQQQDDHVNKIHILKIKMLSLGIIYCLRFRKICIIKILREKFVY